ncbi:sensor histidine kinase [Acrocarpospora pleiomorpha]|nr:sensor histidine kinase [Acrocarpospora pleiomorpha]
MDVSPGNAWEAMSQPPLRLLRSSWPWRSFGYAMSGALIGALLLGVLTLVVVAVTTTAPYLIVMLVLFFVYVSRPVARFERRRLRLVDFEPAQADYRRADADSLTARLAARFTDPATWRELAYAVLFGSALWGVDLVAGLILAGLPVLCLTSVVWVWFTDETWLLALLLFPVGVVLLGAGGLMTCAYAGARTTITRALIAPQPSGLQRRVQELTSSRARLVAAFEAERRRIERDLHDGAQQRITALTMSLGLAQLDLPTGSPAAAQVAKAQELAGLAMTEIRGLIHGIHPQVLTDRGLAAAVEDLAARSPIPVDVDICLPGRLPQPVETAAYFVVSEALANVVKHSNASRGSLRARHEAGVLTLRVRDDGTGGADLAAGTGLTGLADRIAVLEGTLELFSPPGGPTALTVEIPCASTGP